MRRAHERVNEACEFEKIGIKRGKSSRFSTKIPSLRNREFAWNKIENEENSFSIPYTSLGSEKNSIPFHYEIEIEWNKMKFTVTLI